MNFHLLAAWKKKKEKQFSQEKRLAEFAYRLN